MLPAVAQGQGRPIDSSKSPPAQVQPSPAALELARALAAPRLLWLARTTAGETKKRVKSELLSVHLSTRGMGCDPRNPECQAAADAMASKHAEEYARMVNEAIDRDWARIFEAKMSPAQIRSTLSFAKTDAGQAFAAAFQVDPTTDRTLLAHILGTTKLPQSPFDEFYDATKQLPRAPLPFVPPVLAPPPPARPDH